MSAEFQPQLSVLPPQQRRLWPQLVDVPNVFVLCGDTAVALHLGHRSSVDFDFFGSSEFDPDLLYATVPFLKGASIQQKSPSTLTCLVDRGGPVQISFFGAPSVRLIGSPHTSPDNNLKIASLLNLAGLKAAVVQKRAEAKDYLDFAAIIDIGGIDLPTALAAAREIFGPSFNPQLTLKSLSFFGDGNLPTIPRSTQDKLSAAVKAVDLDRLPDLAK